MDGEFALSPNCFSLKAKETHLLKVKYLFLFMNIYLQVKSLNKDKTAPDDSGWRLLGELPPV